MRSWRWLGLAFACLVSGLVLLNSEVIPLGAVRSEDLDSDYGLLTWNFWATTESAMRHESLYQTRLVFHPLGSNLAAHTLGAGFTPLGLLARSARGGRPDYPLYAHRGAILVCFTLGMFLAHLALRRLGASAPAALAGSLGWAFAACWRLIVANQTLASACFLIPAVTLGLLGAARAPSAARAVGLAALVSATVYFSEYFAVFTLLALVVLVASAFLFSAMRKSLGTLASSIGVRGAMSAAGVGLLVSLPFVTAWLDSEGRPPRPRQVHAGGANLAGFFLPDASVTPLYSGEAVSSLHALVTRGRGPFLGIPTLLLASLAVARRLGPWRLLLIQAAVFFLLSLGTHLKVLGLNTGIPLPYAGSCTSPRLTWRGSPCVSPCSASGR
jgi:hypothetical protein